jgi:hypothetical protein
MESEVFYSISIPCHTYKSKHYSEEHMEQMMEEARRLAKSEDRAIYIMKSIKKIEFNAFVETDLS